MTTTTKRPTTAQAIREAYAANRSATTPEPPSGIVERLLRRKAPRKRKPAMPQRFSMLATRPLFAERRGQVRVFEPLGAAERDSLRPAVKIIERPGRPSARGWRGAMAAFTGLGLVVVPAPGDRATLTSGTGKWRCPEGTLAEFDLVADWIGAGLAGKPWPCAWCPSEAIDLLAGRIPACDEHAR